MPFFSKAPVCTLLYSSEKHSRDLQELYIRCGQSRSPVVMAMKAGKFSFGCYLSHPIHLNGLWAGFPTCFIYSATLGLKLPYHGHESPIVPELANTTQAGFYADLDQLLIGNGDIAINSDLSSGSSNLERCYGVGLSPQDWHSKVLLAGSEFFNIDCIEIWSIQ